MALDVEDTNAADNLELTVDAFVRSIGIRRSSSHTLFIGAGASISSGIPSAQSCIWEWKRDLFLTNNPGLEEQFSELSLPSVRSRIQAWLDKQSNYPVEGAAEEYGFYIKKCFPIADDRRAYFQEKVRVGQPHVGYRLLCYLAQAELVRTVWTTNFDGFVARAASNSKLVPIEIGIDTQARLPRIATKNELLCISMHGDYRYDALKNTPEELQQQEEKLRAGLIKEIGDSPIIVSGYSGRDTSVMEAFQAGYSTTGKGTLYWCGYSDGDIPPPVVNLIQHARKSGRQAYYVRSLGFDDLMTRVALHCLEGELRDGAKDLISRLASKDTGSRKPFHVAEHSTNTLIKSNAFEIDCPSEVFTFDLKEWPKEKVWSWLRDQVGQRQVVIAPFRGKVLALGTLDDIKDAFADKIKGAIERSPVSPDEFNFEDGAITGLMRQALVRSMAQTIGVNSDGRSEIWVDDISERFTKANVQYTAHESAIVYIRRVGDKKYLILKPSIKVMDQSGAEVPREIADPVKIRILGYQHNKPFNAAVNNWRSLLFPKNDPIFEYPINVASNFKFRVSRAPAFGKVGLPKGGKSVVISDSIRPHVKYGGVELREPQLVFSNKQGTKPVSDTHPIRGMISNRPYDFPLTVQGLAPNLRIGVVCPDSEARLFHQYLTKVNAQHRPSDKERDYLFDYNGFSSIYGLPIEIPQPGGPGWVSCSEPAGADERAASVSVAQQITRAIETLRSSFAPHVVIVFFPTRWEHFRGYRTDSERFDVHDFVKAYAVQRGVASQFLTQETLADAQQCRVWWWLSLALYVKGMRTPWVLHELDESTAFVGLGFSIDRNAQKGSHIVLGCSHIYSSKGEGLQYRLSKVEDPIIRQGNPFMSKDDARRTGDTIRQLYFDARHQLPRRVVIHKKTPFLKDEREGLLDGLSGVAEVDMIEIQIDHALRYLASTPTKDGGVDNDNYPVRRGTTLKLDDFTALLWVHGSTEAVNNRTYFQGKRRIPAPLTIRRHAGSTELEKLGAEILGLSKMNWNTFDLYTKLPATLQSSGEIARIGSLLQRFGASSYDYRLFI